jgi:glycosyltransferase involved in cell wall biosynthesis
MPSFNQSQYIEEAIRSVLDQNYPNLEFLIIDGGSTDNSQEIIKHYSDHLTYWHSHRDEGQADALIQGFSRASGELLGWLNSDDILLPGALFHITKAYQSHPKGGIFAGNILWIDENGNIIRTKRHPSSVAWFAQHGLFFITQPGSFFTRKDYEKVGGLNSELHYVMDADLYMRMIHNHTSYVKVEAWVSGFRLHSLSKTVLHRSEFMMEYETLQREYLPWIKQKPAVMYLYRGLQLVNGNYIKTLIDIWFARGKHWRKWCRNYLGEPCGDYERVFNAGRLQSRKREN